MRPDDEIGDDAFHLIEEELDWLEMAKRRPGRRGTAARDPNRENGLKPPHRGTAKSLIHGRTAAVRIDI
jgi:hypothetical protein